MKLPQIPTDWSWLKVGELGADDRPAVKAGPFGSALKKEFYTSSGYRIYGQEQVIAGDLSIGDYYINQDRFEKLQSCEVRSGDILISLVGTFGKILVVPDSFEPGIINPRLVRLSLNLDRIEPNFFSWFFQSPMAKLQMELQSHGGTMGILNAKNIAGLFLPLPPIAEQRRIAAILDKADAVRRKRKEAIALTEELLRSAFLEMFGDLVTNPKGWKSKKLEAFSIIQSGIAKGKKIDQSQSIYIPYMRVANVQDGRIDLSEIKEISVLPKDLERYSLQYGDVLLTEGGDPDKLGRGAVWYDQIKPCIHQNHVFCVRPDCSVAEPEYLSAIIGSSYGKRYFLRAAKQTTGIATINKTQLRDFPTYLPPIEKQKEYVVAIQKIREAQAKLEGQIEESANLFNSLLQRAFRGDL